MNLLCTFPGKYGDLLWALPTVRALSRRIGGPVDLAIPLAFESIAPLIRLQSYIRQVFPLDDWITRDTAPISPREPPAAPDTSGGRAMGGPYTAVLHLGYRDWPLPDVCRHTLETARVEGDWLIQEEELCLFQPWIRVPDKYADHSWDWVYGFTDEFFELKFGLVVLLEQGRFKRHHIPATGIGSSPRWSTEAGNFQTSWEGSAAILQKSKAFLGCCSALHVLAVACGCPVVLMEPQPMRHNQVFYPLGVDGRQGVTLVTGSDGKPTWDARHVADTLYDRIHGRPHA